MQNKSQMEIMGLVIIIILIAIGMLFAVQFMLKKPTGKPTAAVKESILAANFLNALLSTSTDCYERNIRELLQDCALTSGATTCTSEGGFPMNSCDYVEAQIRYILDNSIDMWNKDYYFTIEGSSDVERIMIGTLDDEPCPGEREAKSHPVPVRPGFEIKLWLEICG